jgi:peptidoglycan/LPS O-acetylase OafA/YrhL
MLLPLWEKLELRKAFSRYGTWSFCALSLLFPAFPGSLLKEIVLFASFLVLLPLVFLFQNDHKLDKLIGDLSYPIYIGHMLVILVLGHFVGQFGIHTELVASILNVGAAVVFAMILNGLVAQPIERVRKRLRGRDALPQAHKQAGGSTSEIISEPV